MRLNKNIKIFLNYFLGPALFLWLSYSIYNQVKHQPDLKTSWIKIKQSLQSTEIWDLAIVIFLMIINWSIEALKWKISIQKVQPVSFSRSFSAILSGVSFSVSTPNRIGECLGRILYIEEGNRLRVISLTIVSSISQLIITLFAGSAGLFSKTLLPLRPSAHPTIWRRRTFWRWLKSSTRLRSMLPCRRRAYRF